MSLRFSRREFLDGVRTLATSAVVAPSNLRFGSVRVGEQMKPEERSRKRIEKFGKMGFYNEVNA